jgi:hypothetical protein
MNYIAYRLKLKGLSSLPGAIPFKALGEIQAALVESAERNLRMAVQGEGALRKGKLPSWLDDSLDFVLTGVESGSTVLIIDAPTLGDTAAEQIKQQDLWYKAPQADDTALSLVARSMKGATSDGEFQDADVGVLEGLLKFKPLLSKYVNEIELICQDRPKENFLIDNQAMEKITTLRRKTPEPAAFVVSGQLNSIRYSSKRFELLLSNNQTLSGIPDPEFLHAEDMRAWWGKNVSVKGMVYFSSSGKPRLIEAQVIQSMTEADMVFDRLPQPSESLELLDPSFRKSSGRSPLREIWDQWPGDETIEELLSDLKSS